jgi:hypothetical protein
MVREREERGYFRTFGLTAVHNFLKSLINQSAHSLLNCPFNLKSSMLPRIMKSAKYMATVKIKHPKIKKSKCPSI